MCMKWGIFILALNLVFVVGGIQLEQKLFVVLLALFSSRE